MYGLPSKDSLSKRQTNWNYDQYESVNKYDVVDYGYTTTDIDYEQTDWSTSRLISLIDEDPIDVKKDETEITNNCLKSSVALLIKPTERSHPQLTQVYDDTQIYDDNQNIHGILQLINDCKKEQENNIQDIAIENTINNRLTSLENLVNGRLTSLENLINGRLTSLENTIMNSQKDQKYNTDKSEKNEKKEKYHVKRRKFQPYFINKRYMGRDNKTTIDGYHMEMIVELIGLPDKLPSIYPFSDATDVLLSSQINNQVVTLQFKDSKGEEGTIDGKIILNKSHIWKIKLDINYLEILKPYVLPIIFQIIIDL